MITIVDYGCGNLGSITNMLKKIGVNSQITSNEAVIQNANKIILPGVGAFDVAMTCIQKSGLLNILEHKILTERVPMLGICLGMQILLSESEEGNCKGLGWIKGKVKNFAPDEDADFRSTHMGWNAVRYNEQNPLMTGLSTVAADYDTTRFYFVHSYYAHVENPDESIGKTNYGVEFDSAIHRENIYGVQFHPEKSHKFGMKLLTNFAEID